MVTDIFIIKCKPEYNPILNNNKKIINIVKYTQRIFVFLFLSIILSIGFAFELKTTGTIRKAIAQIITVS